MLSSIIFHFIFAFFAVWAGIAWLLESQRLKSLRYTLIPLLALDSITFPKHRSLVVRGLKSLSFELSRVLSLKVEVIFLVEKNVQISHNPFHPLCRLFDSHASASEKCIKFSENMLTTAEFLQQIKYLIASSTKMENIIFKYSMTELVWCVEISYHV